jgi:glyoxylase-like metal-dependent hydrolase (beta-lactamase superfamily II)
VSAEPDNQVGAKPETQTSGKPRKQEQEPAATEVTEVAPGVLRLQLPIQFTGLGHVNCYALEDERGFAIVDPGMPGPQSWRDLLDRLGRAGIPLKRIHTVVVTHSHPDHFGGAGKLRAETGAEVVAHTKFRTLWDPWEDKDYWEENDDGQAIPRPRHSAVGRRLKPWDVPSPWGGRMPRPPMKFRLLFQLRFLMRRHFGTPTPSARLADANTIRLARRDWVALHTPGHTNDHLCLFDPAEGVLLSGDHVLPSITPHISGIGSRDALADFFASLDRVAELDGVRAVLPAHGHPFTDVAGRVKDIHRHHEDRLAKLREGSAQMGPATVEQLTTVLFPPRHHGPMADSETYAHLEHLRLAGEAERRREDDHLLYVVSN